MGENSKSSEEKFVNLIRILNKKIGTKSQETKNSKVSK